MEALWLSNVSLSLSHEPGNQFLSLLKDHQQQKPHALFRSFNISKDHQKLYFLKGSKESGVSVLIFFNSSVSWLVLFVNLAQPRILKKESLTEEISSSICPWAC